ncbi:MAG TPA: hypothetical protein VE687_18390 [Stellaceae bacterium]|jgi:hypothetical protein|nr:hypothetical protein [Stellaceae bacterium]
MNEARTDNFAAIADHLRMTPHTARAADDFATIHRRMTALRLQRDGKCAIRDGKSSADCWCYKAGPDGNTLPCPPAAEAPL